MATKETVLGRNVKCDRKTEHPGTDTKRVEARALASKAFELPPVTFNGMRFSRVQIIFFDDGHIHTHLRFSSSKADNRVNLRYLVRDATGAEFMHWPAIFDYEVWFIYTAKEANKEYQKDFTKDYYGKVKDNFAKIASVTLSLKKDREAKGGKEARG